MKQCLVNMSPKLLSLLAGASCLLLAGCTSAQHAANASDEEKLPQQQVADFLSTDCMDVWSLHGETTDKNPLYWLRSMDCSERLSPEIARTEARLHSEDSWQDAFRRGILLDNAKITPVERREAVNRLDSFSAQIPSQVRPLYQVWRDGQASLLQLSEERSRYSKLQQSSDAELEIMRQQQQHLSSQLELTTRKLENLTDIERQLSSRKPAGSNFSPDSGHSSDPSSASKDAPAGEDKP
ncbi:two-component system QseEF-associated lipoprotein QseG [Pseudescherichia vulneris]